MHPLPPDGGIHWVCPIFRWKRADKNDNKKIMSSVPGNDLDLGQIAGSKQLSLGFPPEERDKHLYVCGTTGMGKSKFLESLIQQDILAWRRSRCGLILLDPHGNLYDNLIRWCAWLKLDNLPIIPIDLRQDDWVVSYNLLRQRKGATSVIVDQITEAMAHVWGQSDTKQTPLFARWIGNVLTALYENKLTLVEAQNLVSHVDRQVQYALTANLKDPAARDDWHFSRTLSPKDFETQISSTVNRLRRFISNPTMRAVFGSPGASLDLGEAVEKGSIILVNLATANAKISATDAGVFATVLLNDLWKAAEARGKRDGVKPFYVYVDEFQRFVTPTIAENLAEARGFGLHFTMAHQFPEQLRDLGENGKRLYNAAIENASSKVVFRLTAKVNLEPLAEWLFRGVMDPDEIKHELYSTKVMKYVEEIKIIHGASKTKAHSRGFAEGQAAGAGMGGTQYIYNELETLRGTLSDSSFESDSSSSMVGDSEAETASITHVPTPVPVFGEELSNVQFRSLQEQLHRAMKVLFDQQERHGVARLVSMNRPVSITTPTVNEVPGSEEHTKRFLNKLYRKLPYAVRGDKAQKALDERERYYKEDFLKETSDEPTTAARRVQVQLTS